MPETWRRTLFAFGICCLTLSISMTGYLADGRGGLSFPVRWALFAPAAAPAPSPTPAELAIAQPAAEPLPSPVVVRRHSFLGEGPITIRGDGNVALALSRTSRYDFTQDVSSLGSQMTFDVERRTERASVHLSQSVGYAPGATAFGQIQGAYTTPQYELGYGPLAGPAETQLGIGGFAKGVGITIPRRGGELAFMGATATQQDGSGLRVFGVRRETATKSGTFAYSGFYGMGEHNPDREFIVDVSNRHYGPRLSTFTELAFSSTRNVAGIENGVRPAFALQADLNGSHGFSAFTLRAAPAGFATLTSVAPPSLDADLTLRRDFRGGTSANLDVAENDTRLADATSRTRRVTATITRSLPFGSATLLANVATNSYGGATSVNRSAGLSLSQQTHGFALSESAQFASVSGDAGSAVQRQFDLGATRNVLGGTLSLVGSHTSSEGEGSSTTDSSAGVRYIRTLGRKLDLALAQTVEATNSGGIVTHQSTTSLGLIRRLSSVVSVHVAGTRTIQSGAGGGASNALSLDIVGPLGFGDSHYTGRSNPNVPATIRGSVTFATTTQDYGASASRGFGNVLVVLDGRYSQRTDARGEFEFRFVPQGTHTVTLEPGSLATGLIADHESETMRVLGGQVLTLAFRVGNFAGIGGRLTVMREGKEEPLGGIALIVDKRQRILTAPDGRYQLGRLTPGPHSVEVAMETVPSSVHFDKSEESVVVNAGNVTKVDFHGTPLGSIAGMVLYAPEAGFADLRGAKNVYVLAQPGDHAAITNEDGSFLLDNLIPGSYTLSIDPETLPDGEDVVQQPDGPLTLAPGAQVSGTIFKLGTRAKNVIFTFSEGKRYPISVNVDPLTAPPGALVNVVARTSAKGIKALYVESDVFGNFPLRFDRALDTFNAAFVVPALQKGTYALTVSSHESSTADGDAVVSVDPATRLVAVRMVPAHPTAGHAVHVIAKVLAPIEEGDVLTFEDGFAVKLPAPQHRVVSFDARIWGRGVPYAGQIVTRSGMHIPLILR